MDKLTKKDAIILGCKRFNTGEVCESCGTVSSRFVNNGKCVECRHRIGKRNYTQKKKTILNRHNKHNQMNPEERREAKARSERKKQARKVWAINTAHKMINEGQGTALDEVKRIEGVIEQNCELACNIKDMKMLRDKLLTGAGKKVGGMIRISRCPLCRQDRTFSPGSHLTHECDGQKKQAKWIKENYPPELVFKEDR